MIFIVESHEVKGEWFLKFVILELEGNQEGSQA